MSQRSIPEIIWMYWEQGWDNAPYVVQQCKKSWQHHNPDRDIRLLDRKSLLEYFDIKEWVPHKVGWRRNSLTRIKNALHDVLHRSQLINGKAITVQHRSDIIRINLLSKYGGVWCDATTWCTKPLEEWLPLHLKEDDFFAFCTTNSPANISNWFLACRDNSYIVEKMRKKVCEYWQAHDSADEYYWFHSSFRRLYESEPEFKEHWDRVSKMDSGKGAGRGPMYFSPCTAKELEGCTEQYKKMLARNEFPMFKLTFKRKPPIEQYDKIQYLFDTLD